MIAYLKGTVLKKNEKSLIVANQGLGYEVFVVSELISKIGLESTVELWIHPIIREDEWSLYGFDSQDQMSFFKQLISVSGIGPKMGIEILSAPLELVQQAIINEDLAVLTAIKGLGKKTAERLVLELKNKITPVKLSLGNARASHQEVIEALVGLGYEKYHVVQALSTLPESLTETEAIIRFFLKNQ
ncbi:Holliday junction branch migration protein RuvA [Candidatus Peregrinibacteria bacterium]|nr:MAG: Holliday junction branch migration protein RuvA [Candidatus Peregrinibacteria bacterium]